MESVPVQTVVTIVGALLAIINGITIFLLSKFLSDVNDVKEVLKKLEESKVNNATLEDKFGIITNQLNSIIQTQTGLTSKLEETQTGLTSKLEETKTGLTSKLEETQTGLTSKLEETKTGLTTKLEETQTGLTSKLEETKTGLTTKLDNLQLDVSYIRERVSVIKASLNHTNPRCNQRISGFFWLFWLFFAR
jgi:DNA anti-recombination protein RmuC